MLKLFTIDIDFTSKKVLVRLVHSLQKNKLDNNFQWTYSCNHWMLTWNRRLDTIRDLVVKAVHRALTVMQQLSGAGGFQEFPCTLQHKNK